MIEFAELCGILGQPAAAARLYAMALDASTPPAMDVRSDHRYRAACAAALAGCRRGDGANLSPAEQARWRERAREWLHEPKSPCGPASWITVHPRTAPWLLRSWRISGPIPTWPGCWTRSRRVSCRRPNARNAASFRARSTR